MVKKQLLPLIFQRNPMPTSPENDLADLVHQAQAGSNGAAKILFDKWQKPLLRVIRQKLDRRLRRIFDSDDFVQGAMAEFFARALEAGDFDTPQGLLAYVKTIAENKVRDAARKYLQSQRSNFTKDVPLEQTAAAKHVITGTASPDGEFADETMGRLRMEMAKLPLVDRTIMEFLVNGHKPAAIARFLNLDMEFVYRRIGSAKRTAKKNWVMAQQ